jgi:FixJ family two-component response regulator
MSGETSMTTRRIAVAIVDDDASVRIGLRRLCTAFGMAATAYASGREFLVALEHDPSIAECLILDTHMPEMSGIELQRHLLAQGTYIPTIVVTADEASAAHYVADGVVAFLRKPVVGDDLLAAIARAVPMKAERRGS